MAKTSRSPAVASSIPGLGYMEKKANTGSVKQMDEWHKGEKTGEY